MMKTVILISTCALLATACGVLKVPWNLKNTGQLAGAVAATEDDPAIAASAGTPGIDVNVVPAWTITKGDPSVLVGILETTDVDINHPELSGSIRQNSSADGDTCTTGHGCNFLGADPVGIDTPDTGDDGHASHIAGIIGGDEIAGHAGVAPNVTLVPLTAKATNNGGFVQAIEYAKARGIRVMNVSQGNREDAAYRDPAVRDEMKNSDILFVCSGGNDGALHRNYPSSFDIPNIISVASLDHTGALLRTSGHAPDHVDIAAPGGVIESTIPGKKPYGTMSGTSQAAAHVTGVAALVLSQFPKISIADLKQRILGSRMRLTSLDQMVGSGGIVDAYAAVKGVSGTELSATATEDSITLHWNRQSGESSYEIERDGAVLATQTGSTFVDTETTAGSSHIYRVRAVSNEEWSHRVMAKAENPVAWNSLSIEGNTESGKELTVYAPAGAKRFRVHFEEINLPETKPGQVYDEREKMNGYLSFSSEVVGGAWLGGQYPSGAWSDWEDLSDPAALPEFIFNYKHPRGQNAPGFKIDRVEFIP